MKKKIKLQEPHRHKFDQHKMIKCDYYYDYYKCTECGEVFKIDCYGR